MAHDAEVAETAFPALSQTSLRKIIPSYTDALSLPFAPSSSHHLGCPWWLMPPSCYPIPPDLGPEPNPGPIDRSSSQQPHTVCAVSLLTQSNKLPKRARARQTFDAISGSRCGCAEVQRGMPSEHRVGQWTWSWDTALGLTFVTNISITLPDTHVFTACACLQLQSYVVGRVSSDRRGSQQLQLPAGSDGVTHCSTD